VKTFLQHGIDTMLPAGLLPWYVIFGRKCLFWLRNKHKDKTPEQRCRLAI
jgi:ubiquinone biosynthesis protein